VYRYGKRHMCRKTGISRLYKLELVQFRAKLHEWRTAMSARNKHRLALFLLTCGAMLLNADVAFAQGLKEPQWWEIVTGILAIPASLIGLAYSYILIRKTRLEAKKTELEILEKEQALQKLSTEQQELVLEAVRPLAQVNIALYLVLRFVVVYLILKAWGLVEVGYNVITSGVYLGLSEFLRLDLFAKLDSQNLWHMLPVYLIANLPKIGYWIVFLAIGWPLFKDANRLMGLDLKDLFRWDLGRKGTRGEVPNSSEEAS
jgi:hypothetical protein